MSPEETHQYRLEASPGVFVQILVEQRGVDVELHLEGPQGAWTRDGYYEPGSVDRLSRILEAGGSYRLEVAPHGSESGVYGLRLEMRPPTLADHAAARAEDLSFRALVAYASARLPEAVGLWDRALPLWQWARDPWGEAEALYWSAKALERLKEPERAAERYARAAERYAEAPAAFPTAARQRARSLANAGVLEKDLGRLKAAEAKLRAAVAAWSDLSDETELVVSLNNLGRVLRARGDSLGALERFERSLALCRAREDPLDQARVLGDLAIVNKDLGRPHEALDHLTEALRLYDAHAPEHPGRATILNNLGATLTELGEFHLARSHYQQALDFHQETPRRDGRAPELLATTLNNLGWVHRELEDLDLAQRRLDEARALAREHDLGRLRLDVLDNLALLHLKKDQPETAVQALEEALAALPVSGDPRQRTVLLQDLGRALLEAGRPDAARQPLETSRELAREIRDQAAESRALLRLARVESVLGNHEAASRRATEALARVESQRAAVPHPFHRMSWTAMRRQTYETVVDLLMTAHEAQPRAGWDVRAFETAERARGRGLVEMLQEARVDPYRGVDAELIRDLETLRDRLRAAETRRLAAIHQPGGESRLETLEREVERLLLALGTVESRIRRQNPEYDELTYPRPIPLEEARGLLDSDTVFLTFMLGEDRSFLWVVAPQKLTSFVLPPRRVLDEMVEDFVDRLRLGDAAFAEALRLSRAVLEPARRHLQSHRWAVVADGSLHHVPFAALPEPGRNEPVVARHEVAYVPSLTALAELRRRPAAGVSGPRLAVVADPVFDRIDPRIAIDSSSAPPAPPLLRADLGRLPSTAEEARTIAELVGPDRVRLLLGFDATREAVLGGALSGADIVHFATHAFVGSRRTDLVRLELSRFDTRGREIEGALYYRDLYELDLQARLVVLSACETAMGRELRGEGLVGLSHGLLAAGARRILASLWRIDDAATADFMRILYRNLLEEGSPPSAALHRTQKRLWMESEESKNASPWAAFILQGDWRN